MLPRPLRTPTDRVRPTTEVQALLRAIARELLTLRAQRRHQRTQQPSVPLRSRKATRSP